MNLESLLMMSQSHLSDWWYSPRLIHLHRPAIILLSHGILFSLIFYFRFYSFSSFIFLYLLFCIDVLVVLSRFCAELLYDAGIIAMGAKEINSGKFHSFPFSPLSLSLILFL